MYVDPFNCTEKSKDKNTKKDKLVMVFENLHISVLDTKLPLDFSHL